LLNQEGYTVRGVQKLLREKVEVASSPVSKMPAAQSPAVSDEHDRTAGVDMFRLIALRNRLASAIDS
jgi:hypothetical protein